MIILCILVAIVSISTADLPSCKRARCSHCALEFISKMCQNTCQECPRTVFDKVSGRKLKVFTENYGPRPTPSSFKKREPSEKKSQKSLKEPLINVAPRQSGVATQTRQQFPNSNVANEVQQHVQPPLPQGYLPGNQFNQPKTDISTLAPLIPPPRPTDINSNLAQRPADLAHPLPEYQQSAQNVGVFNRQQSTAFQTAAQPQLYATNQNTFAQPAVTDIFGQPVFQAQPPQPLQFPQQQQSTPLLNPFQTFAQQPPSPQSMLDPFGLLNLVGMTQPQGTALGQTSPTSAYNQPQSAYGVGPLANQQSFVNPQQNFQQNPQTNYYGQQQIYNQQPNPQNSVQNYQTALPLQVASSSATRDVYSPQNYQNHLQQGVGPQQRVGGNKAQSKILYQANPAQVKQLYSRQQVVNALPKPQSSSSIDAAPINVQKYVDGKGPVPTNPPQQCPRQPGWAPCISKQAANERFANCCARLGEGCIPFCNYDANLATMQLAVLTGRCPLNKMADIMVCASGYEDATACCEAYNVFERGYEHCRPYCNPAAGLPHGGLLSEKYKCLVKLSTIQQCFYVSQKP